MLEATMALDYLTRRGERWRASCQWRGKTFEAVSANGVSNALCRMLVKAGVPDQALEMRKPNGSLRFTVDSIHEWAKWTWKESPHGPTMQRWKPFPAAPSDQGRALRQATGGSSPK